MAKLCGLFVDRLIFCVGFILCALVYRTSGQQFQIKSIGYPVDTTDFSGETVKFTCTVLESVSENQALDWYILWDGDSLRKAPAQTNSTITASSRPEFTNHGTYTTRYKVTDQQNGTNLHSCNLTISNIRFIDAGYFGCTHQKDPSDNHRTLLEEKIRLDIWPVRANHPECKITESPTSATLNCISSGGSPDAMVSWYNDKGVLQSGPYSISNSLTVSKTSDYQWFVCTARQGTLPPVNCSVSLGPQTGGQTSPTTTTTGTSSTTTKTATTEKKGVNIVVTGRATSEPEFIQTPTTKAIGPTKELQSKDNASLIPIIAAIAGALLVFIIILLLLCLLLGRKKRKTQETENNNDVERRSQTEDVPLPPVPERTTSRTLSFREVPSGPPPTLPTLDLPAQPVQENPYGDLPGGSTLPPAPESPDSIKKLKMENNGFVSDEYDSFSD